VGVLLAALLFGAATALQFVFQALDFNAPYQLFLMFPYVLTRALLAGVVGGVRAPAALGKPAS
jgi:simple sugar transport system permease protein